MSSLVVIGLGYVGLPLAKAAVETGFNVTGFDLSQRVLDTLNSGNSHVDDISASDVKEMIRKGFSATSDESVIGGADVVVICVPTPLSKEGGPDLGAVIGASEAISRQLKPGVLVILESTTYPGTTDDLVKPILEKSGLSADKDFYLAFSPERIDPGNPTFGIRNTPKVVGGYTELAGQKAQGFYATFVEKVVVARGTREAEMAKLLENTYRHVNIALMNELVEFSNLLHIDLWDAINCASSKPFGYQAFYPGPGVGGHCIPIDPNYLSHHVKAELGRPFRFVELAQEINSGMPSYVRQRIQDALNEQEKALKGSHVLLVGVTYKPDIADQRESPVRPLARDLIDRGAIVSYFDPYVTHWNIDSEHGEHDEGRVLIGESELLTAAGSADLVAVLQPHKQINFDELIKSSKSVLDTRGFLNGNNVIRL